jgi:hypothetical protein
VTQASVNNYANAAYALLTEPGQVFRSNGGSDKLSRALKALRAHTDNSPDKGLTQKVAARFRDSLARNQEAANRYRFVDGDKILGLSEGRRAARRLLGRPLHERRIVVARVNRLIESGRHTTTEAGRIAKDLRFRITRGGLSLREAWNSLLKEAQAVNYDDPMDASAFKQFMRSLAGSLVQVGIIKVNNFYRNSRDKRLEVGGIDGAPAGMFAAGGGGGGGRGNGYAANWGASGNDDGGFAPAQNGGGGGGSQAPASKDDEKTEVEKRGMPGQEISQKGVDRALTGMGLGRSQYAYYIAQVAAGHEAGNYPDFATMMDSYIPQNDPVVQELKKDPFKLAFMIAKALRP